MALVKITKKMKTRTGMKEEVEDEWLVAGMLPQKHLETF